MLRAIFAAIHLRLSLRGNGLAVGAALIAETDRRAVAVHDLAVPTQVAPPQVGSKHEKHYVASRLKVVCYRIQQTNGYGIHCFHESCKGFL